ncbi:hypothetical protein ERD78_10915 [Allopusillimonas soli]|uniref:PH (Pleckstrin Homology) domain-containing protein n=1 Tax=Allopusillimonas soli TaxID=659016 RepID=A0A853FCR1_9BURK|nr:hypothetical protein [Allopusillimonas soli]NYT37538.1 hypothetical protein [Allopusillimonas soli]TEA74490.1 hypothetical protein ERD78_10915 [Allopusillimonas soli]
MFQTPSPEEHAQLLRELGPLPVQGMAWPTWIKVATVAMVLAIAGWIVRLASSPELAQIGTPALASFGVCVLGLGVLAWLMVKSQTRITDAGIEQSWLGTRHIAWEEIQYAKFVPLPGAKRLICFTRRNRPVVFQGGTRALHIAFARIAVTYRRRR